MALKFTAPLGLRPFHIIPKHNHLCKLRPLSTSPYSSCSSSKAFAVSEGAEGGVTEEDPPPASVSGNYAVPQKMPLSLRFSGFVLFCFAMDGLTMEPLFLLKDHYLLLGLSSVYWNSSRLLAPPLMVSDSLIFSMIMLDS